MDAFARQLLDWHARSGRHDLPWQHEPTPYRVWVSEIMLQQTQVGTVIPYYQRFMDRFPDVQALAEAPLDEVLTCWAGLGYYARARNLHAAARQVVAQHAGRFPDDFEPLQRLPGIGRSTAAAIAALSAGRRHAILDGNVKRVLSRYHGIDGWPGRAGVARRLWEVAELHTPAKAVAAYTQAIMDLGATVCTRRRPACEHCPVAGDCQARMQGRQHELPAARPRLRRPTRETCMLVVRNRAGEVLLERRPPSGIWAGLWSLPEIDPGEDACDWCRSKLLQEPLAVQAGPRFTHEFTHFRLHISPVEVMIDSASCAIAETDQAWRPSGSSGEYGLPAPVRRILETLEDGCVTGFS